MQLPMSEDLLAIVIRAQRITAQIARKRSRLPGQEMRREDDETSRQYVPAMGMTSRIPRRENAALHRIEALRDQLVAEGDEALACLLDEYPHADRQHLRQLARNAREEKLRNKPPHAYRELFRALRELMQDSGDRDE